MVRQGKPVTAGCLFSGMGGFAAGLSQAGLDIQWASDNDSYACTAFRHRFPHVSMINMDVRQLSVEENHLTPVDVLAAGFPCQSFSQAGSRKGFQDPRGTLFFEIPRLIQEFSEEDRPALVVLENVPHLLYGANGCWFDQIRRAMRHAGYWFREETCWTVNVKDVTDSPQDRERLFMVAAARRHFSRNPFSGERLVNATKPHRRSLDEFIDRTQRADLEAYLPPDNRYYKMIDQAMDSGESANNIYQLRRSYVREKKQGLCPTLTANMGVGGHNVPFVRDSWGIRRLSVAEVAALQGFDIAGGIFPNIPVAEQYRLLGNAVCVDLAHLIGSACANILSGEANAN